MRIEIRNPEGRQVPTGQRGEIWFNGPMLIRGYWNKPEATADTIVEAKDPLPPIRRTYRYAIPGPIVGDTARRARLGRGLTSKNSATNRR